jgi:hypothetical protein
MLVVGSVIVPALAVGLAVAVLALRLPSITSPAARVDQLAAHLTGHPRLVRFLQARADPAVLTGLALSALSLVTIVAGAGLGVLLVMIRVHAGLASFDMRIAEFGADHASGAPHADPARRRVPSRRRGRPAIDPLTAASGRQSRCCSGAGARAGRRRRSRAGRLLSPSRSAALGRCSACTG